MPEDILDQIDNALADVSACFCGCKKALRATSPSPWFASEECQARWGARQLRAKSGVEETAAAVEAAVAAAEVLADYMEQRMFADVAAGPSAGANTAPVDLRRRIQDGTAPTPGVDRVHDAFRAEVIRQGLREYSVDGVRYVVDDESAEGRRLIRSRFPRTVGNDIVDLATCNDRLDSFFGDVLYCAEEPDHRLPHRRGQATWTTPADFASPAAPLVDAALEPVPDVRPWWRRMLPGGRR
jgi:hypothetical protein